MGQPPGNGRHDPNFAIGKALAISSPTASRSRGENRQGFRTYAVHIGGQELVCTTRNCPKQRLSDVRSRYQMDATPGRHMLSWVSFVFSDIREHGRNVFPGRLVRQQGQIRRFLNAVTGWNIQPPICSGRERVATPPRFYCVRDC